MSNGLRIIEHGLSYDHDLLLGKIFEQRHRLIFGFFWSFGANEAELVVTVTQIFFGWYQFVNSNFIERNRLA